MKLAALFLCLFACANAVAADTPLIDQSRLAIEDIETARAALDEASGARDRVQALTGAVRAFEEGLAALRSGTRALESKEQALQARLQSQDTRTAALLSALQRMSAHPAPALFLHPAGPAGSVRASLLLSDVVPRLDAAAAGLRADLKELAALSELHRSAETALLRGRDELAMARQELTEAIAERAPLPKRLVNDPVREAILIASTDTLEQFADGLERVAVDLQAPAPSALAGEKGALPLPVSGRLILRAGDSDARGVERPGITIETAPQALVTSPVAATVRYAGPLLDLGTLTILEPQQDVLFVFAGLDTLYTAAGEVVEAGAPLGLMGTAGQKITSDGSTDGDEAGARLTETLYIEVRRDNLPEDPGLWFQIEQDG
jgi:septal ring factor EnvC (AmiA/AmiB activator)